MPIVKTTLATAISLICSTTALAGNLNAPSAPNDAGSAMYQLADVYNRVNAGTPGSKRDGSFVEPTSGPLAGTGHTLDDVMDKAPSVDNADGTQPDGVLAGGTYWSLRTDGTWGLQTGTMPNNGTTFYTPGTTNQTIHEGYHTGAGVVDGDYDLKASNIIEGIHIFGVVGTAIVTLVPESGQTTQYSGTYTAVEDGGANPPGEALPTNDRFTNNSDGTVTDNLTGLIWLTKANCIATDNASFDADGAVPWLKALEFVAGINSGTYDCSDTSNGGNYQTDWRLPTRNELFSLIDAGYYGPALTDAAGTAKWTSDGDAFSGVVSSRYWSSTTYASNTTLAWFVFLGNGYVGYDDKTSSYYVWPVRGGQ